MFEPDNTEEELREIDEHARRKREQDPDGEGGSPRPTISEDWWCLCGCCEQMPKEEDVSAVKSGNCGCKKVVMSLRRTRTVMVDYNCEDFPHFTHRTVLEAFLRIPKVNGKKRPRAEGAALFHKVSTLHINTPSASTWFSRETPRVFELELVLQTRWLD